MGFVKAYGMCKKMLIHVFKIYVLFALSKTQLFPTEKYFSELYGLVVFNQYLLTRLKDT